LFERKKTFMLVVFILLIAGFAIGFGIKSYRKLTQIVEFLTTLSIYGLLFFLGISIGKNEVLFNSFGTLGWNAIILSFGGILGSIIVAKMAEKFIFRQK